MSQSLSAPAGFVRGALVSATTASHPRTAYLTGLRGYAALGVVAIHTGMGGIGSLGEFFASLVNHGKYGVSIFFVLSAYSICLSLAGQKTIRLRPYWMRRISRIIPLYFTLLIVAWLIGYQSYWGDVLNRPHDLTSLLGHFSFYNILDVRYANNALGVEWSIPVEFFFYVFLPGMVLLSRRFWGGLVLLVLCHGCQKVSCFLPSYIEPQSGYQYLEGIWRPFAYVWCFAAGVLACAVATRHTQFKQWFERRPFFAASLGVWLGTLAFYSEVPHAFYSVLCIALIFTAGPANRLSRCLLENRVQLFFGNISFSMYMCHHMLWKLLSPHLSGSSPCKFVQYFIVLCVVSLLTYTLLEYPFFHKKTRGGMQ
ncbi:MAG: acyltransferase [Desulfovibrio sp.]|jgi:peptidoglycan/LPS O-acetylase OafA/YrhL|nr:acyltransferase [Desulfovibrio sp.]